MNTPNFKPPASVDHYFRLWNECDLTKIRAHINQAISTDCLWTDPQQSHKGRDGLEENVRNFRIKFPQAQLALSSKIDGYDKRLRYHWRIENNGKLLIKGFDVVALDKAGLICRIDGFFGDLQETSNTKTTI